MDWTTIFIGICLVRVGAVLFGIPLGAMIAKRRIWKQLEAQDEPVAVIRQSDVLDAEYIG